MLVLSDWYITEIFHYIGVFGGAQLESGASDVVHTLLAVYGYVTRHLRFVHKLIESSVHIHKEQQCKVFAVVSHRRAANILEQMKLRLEECIYKAFSLEAYVESKNTTATAQHCLYTVHKHSELLFKDYNRIKHRLL